MHIWPAFLVPFLLTCNVLSARKALRCVVADELALGHPNNLSAFVEATVPANAAGLKLWSWLAGVPSHLLSQLAMLDHAKHSSLGRELGVVHTWELDRWEACTTDGRAKFGVVPQLVGDRASARFVRSRGPQ